MLCAGNMARSESSNACIPSVTTTSPTAKIYIFVFISSIKDGVYNYDALMQIEQLKYFTNKYDPLKRVGYIVYDICDDEKNALDVALYLGAMYKEAHEIDEDFGSILNSKTIDITNILKVMSKAGVNIDGTFDWEQSESPLCPCNVQQIRRIFAFAGDMRRDTEKAISTIFEESNSNALYVSIQADDALHSEYFPRYFVLVDIQSVLAKFTSSLLIHFNWEYVAILHTDHPAQRLRMEKIQKQLDQESVCYLMYQMSIKSTKKDITRTIEQIAGNALLKAIIIVSAFTDDFAINVLQTANEFNLTEKYWVTTDSWYIEEKVTNIVPSIRGNILRISTDDFYRGFLEEFFSLTEEDAINRPWLLHFFKGLNVNDAKTSLGKF